MILVIDNYDSFIYNIVQYIGEFYSDIKVFRNDKITLEEILALSPSGIVISPGPGRPEDSKVSMDILKNIHDVPIFGVCLGHQGIAFAYGGEVVGAENIMHGKASTISHNSQDLFEGVKTPLQAIRYHSLVAKKDSLPEKLEITAQSDDGEIMGLKVKGKDIYGVQFHPESILTEEGKKIIKNFVGLVLKRKSALEEERKNSRIKSLITKASEKNSLSREEAAEMMRFMMKGEASASQMASYLTALRMKGETAEEITGSALAMFESCVKVEADISPLADTCGSGGDKSGTFNISTASAFVAAGSGVYIAKHGNRSITSKSGSADVLEKLGVNIQLDKEKARECIEKAGIAFLFAPYYHPAMKHVMPTRREIGIRTLFNVLGPIVNPAGVKSHVMGVFSKELLELVPPVFLNLGHRHSLVIHGEMGLDEASIEGKTLVREIVNGDIKEWVLNAADYGLDGKLANLKTDSPEKSAEMILNVLEGKEKGDARKAVVLNAGLTIYAAKDVELKDAFRMAEESIDSGKALAALKSLVVVSKI
jgi:anthranilate synthase/phosphoribosyltransferase